MKLWGTNKDAPAAASSGVKKVVYVKSGKKITKFKIRGKKYLYTFKTADAKIAKGIKDAIPPGKYLNIMFEINTSNWLFLVFISLLQGRDQEQECQESCQEELKDIIIVIVLSLYLHIVIIFPYLNRRHILPKYFQYEIYTKGKRKTGIFYKIWDLEKHKKVSFGMASIPKGKGINIVLDALC